MVNHARKGEWKKNETEINEGIRAIKISNNV